MKRFYLCDIIGDGSIDNPYRPAVANHNVAWSGTIPTGADGKPTSAWALVVVESRNHAALIADAKIDPLPDFPMDGKVSAIQQATKNAMKARMTARGINAAFMDGTDGYREVIREIGKKLDATFNENDFDVAE